MCIPKFWKLNEYLVVDRAIGLIHVYARKQLYAGRFVYYNKAAKDKLWDDWKRSRKRNYRLYYTFRGGFPDVLSKIIDEKEYDRKKDIAIMGLGYDKKEAERMQVRDDLFYLVRKELGWTYDKMVEKFKEYNIPASKGNVVRILQKYPETKAFSLKS